MHTEIKMKTRRQVEAGEIGEADCKRFVIPVRNLPSVLSCGDLACNVRAQAIGVSGSAAACG